MKRIVLLLVMSVLSARTVCKDDFLREVHGPILSDAWYPQDPKILETSLHRYFDLVAKNFKVPVSHDSVRALIVPHAGYTYSGLCAATAFSTLFEGVDKKNTHIKRVILLAPSHAVPFNFVALPDFAAYRTSIGNVPVDKASIDILVKRPFFRVHGEAYLTEHSLEVEIPFLQKTIAEYTLVPLIVGSLDQKAVEQVAQALRAIIDEHTLVVVSSDFTHHGARYEYVKFTEDIADRVRELDAAIVKTIIAQSPINFRRIIERTKATICGHEAINILLALIKQGALGDVESRLSCYYASAQIERARTRDVRTPGGGVVIGSLFTNVPDVLMQSSVSYAGLVFTTQKRAMLPIGDRLTGYEKRALLTLARRSIANEFSSAEKKKSDALLYPMAGEGLSMPAGAFVTLKLKNGDLRGCIGSIETEEPLYKTVLERARDAAFRDSRFIPLTEAELNDIVIDISLLEPPKPVANWNDIIVGTHGVILSQGSARAVFLPQVASEQGWDRETMLRHLSEKAGLAADAWRDPQTTFRVFTGGEISE